MRKQTTETRHNRRNRLWYGKQSFFGRVRLNLIGLTLFFDKMLRTLQMAKVEFASANQSPA